MPPEMSPAPAQHAVSQPSRLRALLHQLDRELGPRVHRADRLRQHSSSARFSDLNGSANSSAKNPASKHPTGLRNIDELIGGGFPIGCLSEISGPICSGRTTLVFALLAQATRSGAHVAWVDRADTFDPASAEAAGIVLERVLWVRAQQALVALRCSERILETEGFALVVLDLTRRHQHAPGRGRGRRNDRESIPQAAWLRLTRLAAGKQNTLVLLSDQRLAGSRAALALEMQPAIAHFTGTPALLEALETRALLTRHLEGHLEGHLEDHYAGLHIDSHTDSHTNQGIEHGADHLPDQGPDDSALPTQTATKGPEIELRSETAHRAA